MRVRRSYTLASKKNVQENAVRRDVAKLREATAERVARLTDEIHKELLAWWLARAQAAVSSSHGKPFYQVGRRRNGRLYYFKRVRGAKLEADSVTALMTHWRHYVNHQEGWRRK